MYQKRAATKALMATGMSASAISVGGANIVMHVRAPVTHATPAPTGTIPLATRGTLSIVRRD